MNRKTKSDWIFDITNTILMLVFSIIMLYPLLNVFAISFSDAAAVAKGKVGWFPIGFNLNAYEIMLQDKELWHSYKNTFIYAISGTFITLLFTSLIAYPMAIKNFMLRKFCIVFFVITMFFSGGIIPLFIIIRSLNMIDTIWAIVLPFALSAYNVFVFKSFFESIPPDMRESAHLDGANDFLIWLKIILPLSKPLLATFALFTIVYHWNNWFSALMFLNDSSMYPLQMILRRIVVLEQISGSAASDSKAAIMILSGNVHPKNVQMAAIVITMLPILFIYPYIQKYFVKGVMIGAIKG